MLDEASWALMRRAQLPRVTTGYGGPGDDVDDLGSNGHQHGTLRASSSSLEVLAPLVPPRSEDGNFPPQCQRVIDEQYSPGPARDRTKGASLGACRGWLTIGTVVPLGTCRAQGPWCRVQIPRRRCTLHCALLPLAHGGCWLERQLRGPGMMLFFGMGRYGWPGDGR